MFGVNAIGLMICGRINAHIVGRLGPEFIFRRAMIGDQRVLGIVLFAVAASGRPGGFQALAVPQPLFISTLGFNFSNGFALGLAPFGASAGTASALFGTVQFLMAGAAARRSAHYMMAGPCAMTDVMGASWSAGSCALPLQ